MRKNGGDPKPWIPLVSVPKLPATPEKVAGLAARLVLNGADPAEAEALAVAQLSEPVEMFANLHVTATVERYDDGAVRG